MRQADRSSQTLDTMTAGDDVVEIEFEDKTKHIQDVTGLKRSGFLARFSARLAGTGGSYNIGNAFGLITGLWLHVVLMEKISVSAFFFGSYSAVALTMSMLIFFWSGEMYHRAWDANPAPDLQLNEHGDISSGFGALALGVGLLFLGQPLMAATAGLLHAIGKFGCAYDWSQPQLPKFIRLADFGRSLVVLSWIPSLLAVCFEIISHVTHTGGANEMTLFGPASLLICYVLWLRADLLLIQAPN